ncbi:hypothetical protein CHS0354_001669 [Potamilus streckersoni]|uniref:Uncharacterized protein n=1 Tax=Potamilus streckersoni TaxID=2493646 RepID=A0AAE0RUW6_9BIVA|nr:hypothetical protein CHS0354_001669 [Potamilus streckersoni]
MSLHMSNQSTVVDKLDSVRQSRNKGSSVVTMTSDSPINATGFKIGFSHLFLSPILTDLFSTMVTATVWKKLQHDFISLVGQYTLNQISFGDSATNVFTEVSHVSYFDRKHPASEAFSRKILSHQTRITQGSSMDHNKSSINSNIVQTGMRCTTPSEYYSGVVSGNRGTTATNMISRDSPNRHRCENISHCIDKNGVCGSGINHKDNHELYREGLLYQSVAESRKMKALNRDRYKSEMRTEDGSFHCCFKRLHWNIKRINSSHWMC